MVKKYYKFNFKYIILDFFVEFLYIIRFSSRKLTKKNLPFLFYSINLYNKNYSIYHKLYNLKNTHFYNLFLSFNTKYKKDFFFNSTNSYLYILNGPIKSKEMKSYIFNLNDNYIKLFNIDYIFKFVNINDIKEEFLNYSFFSINVLLYSSHRLFYTYLLYSVKMKLGLNNISIKNLEFFKLKKNSKFHYELNYQLKNRWEYLDNYYFRFKWNYNKLYFNFKSEILRFKKDYFEHAYKPQLPNFKKEYLYEFNYIRPKDFLKRNNYLGIDWVYLSYCSGYSSYQYLPTFLSKNNAPVSIYAELVEGDDKFNLEELEKESKLKKSNTVQLRRRLRRQFLPMDKVKLDHWDSWRIKDSNFFKKYDYLTSNYNFFSIKNTKKFFYLDFKNSLLGTKYNKKIAFKLAIPTSYLNHFYDKLSKYKNLCFINQLQILNRLDTLLYFFYNPKNVSINYSVFLKKKSNYYLKYLKKKITFNILYIEKKKKLTNFNLYKFEKDWLSYYKLNSYINRQKVNISSTYQIKTKTNSSLDILYIYNKNRFKKRIFYIINRFLYNTSLNYNFNLSNFFILLDPFRIILDFIAFEKIDFYLFCKYYFSILEFQKTKNSVYSNNYNYRRINKDYQFSNPIHNSFFERFDYYNAFLKLNTVKDIPIQVRSPWIIEIMKLVPGKLLEHDYHMGFFKYFKSLYKQKFHLNHNPNQNISIYKKSFLNYDFFFNNPYESSFYTSGLYTFLGLTENDIQNYNERNIFVSNYDEKENHETSLMEKQEEVDFGFLLNYNIFNFNELYSLNNLFLIENDLYSFDLLNGKFNANSEWISRYYDIYMSYFLYEFDENLPNNWSYNNVNNYVTNNYINHISYNNIKCLSHHGSFKFNKFDVRFILKKQDLAIKYKDINSFFHHNKPNIQYNLIFKETWEEKGKLEDKLELYYTFLNTYLNIMNQNNLSNYNIKKRKYKLLVKLYKLYGSKFLKKLKYFSNIKRHSLSQIKKYKEIDILYLLLNSKISYNFDFIPEDFVLNVKHPYWFFFFNSIGFDANSFYFFNNLEIDKLYYSYIFKFGKNKISILNNEIVYEGLDVLGSGYFEKRFFSDKDFLFWTKDYSSEKTLEESNHWESEFSWAQLKDHIEGETEQGDASFDIKYDSYFYDSAEGYGNDLDFIYHSLNSIKKKPYFYYYLLYWYIWNNGGVAEMGVVIIFIFIFYLILVTPKFNISNSDYLSIFAYTLASEYRTINFDKRYYIHNHLFDIMHSDFKKDWLLDLNLTVRNTQHNIKKLKTFRNMRDFKNIEGIHPKSAEQTELEKEEKEDPDYNFVERNRQLWEYPIEYREEDTLEPLPKSKIKGISRETMNFGYMPVRPVPENEDAHSPWTLFPISPTFIFDSFKESNQISSKDLMVLWSRMELEDVNKIKKRILWNKKNIKYPVDFENIKYHFYYNPEEDFLNSKLSSRQKKKYTFQPKSDIDFLKLLLKPVRGIFEKVTYPLNLTHSYINIQRRKNNKIYYRYINKFPVRTKKVSDSFKNHYWNENIQKQKRYTTFPIRNILNTKYARLSPFFLYDTQFNLPYEYRGFYHSNISEFKMDPSFDRLHQQYNDNHYLLDNGKEKKTINNLRGSYGRMMGPQEYPFRLQTGSSYLNEKYFDRTEQYLEYKTYGEHFEEEHTDEHFYIDKVGLNLAKATLNPTIWASFLINKHSIHFFNFFDQNVPDLFIWNYIKRQTYPKGTIFNRKWFAPFNSYFYFDQTKQFDFNIFGLKKNVLYPKEYILKYINNILCRMIWLEQHNINYYKEDLYNNSKLEKFISKSKELNLMPYKISCFSSMYTNYTPNELLFLYKILFLNNTNTVSNNFYYILNVSKPVLNRYSSWSGNIGKILHQNLYNINYINERSSQYNIEKTNHYNFKDINNKLMAYNNKIIKYQNYKIGVPFFPSKWIYKFDKSALFNNIHISYWYNHKINSLNFLYHIGFRFMLSNLSFIGWSSISNQYGVRSMYFKRLLSLYSPVLMMPNSFTVPTSLNNVNPSSTWNVWRSLDQTTPHGIYNRSDDYGYNNNYLKFMQRDKFNLYSNIFNISNNILNIVSYNINSNAYYVKKRKLKGLPKYINLEKNKSKKHIGQNLKWINKKETLFDKKKNSNSNVLKGSKTILESKSLKNRETWKKHEKILPFLKKEQNNWIQKNTKNNFRQLSNLYDSRILINKNIVFNKNYKSNLNLLYKKYVYNRNKNKFNAYFMNNVNYYNLSRVNLNSYALKKKDIQDRYISNYKKKFILPIKDKKNNKFLVESKYSFSKNYSNKIEIKKKLVSSNNNSNIFYKSLVIQDRLNSLNISKTNILYILKNWDELLLKTIDNNKKYINKQPLNLYVLKKKYHFKKFFFINKGQFYSSIRTHKKYRYYKLIFPLKQDISYNIKNIYFNFLFKKQFNHNISLFPKNRYISIIKSFKKKNDSFKSVNLTIENKKKNTLKENKSIIMNSYFRKKWEVISDVSKWFFVFKKRQDEGFKHITGDGGRIQVYAFYMNRWQEPKVDYWIKYEAQHRFDLYYRAYGYRKYITLKDAQDKQTWHLDLLLHTAHSLNFPKVLVNSVRSNKPRNYRYNYKNTDRWWYWKRAQLYIDYKTNMLYDPSPGLDYTAKYASRRFNTVFFNIEKELFKNIQKVKDSKFLNIPNVSIYSHIYNHDTDLYKERIFTNFYYTSPYLTSILKNSSKFKHRIFILDNCWSLIISHKEQKSILSKVETSNYLKLPKKIAKKTNISKKNILYFNYNLSSIRNLSFQYILNKKKELRLTNINSKNLLKNYYKLHSTFLFNLTIKIKNLLIQTTNLNLNINNYHGFLLGHIDISNKNPYNQNILSKFVNNHTLSSKLNIIKHITKLKVLKNSFVLNYRDSNYKFKEYKFKYWVNIYNKMNYSLILNKDNNFIFIKSSNLKNIKRNFMNFDFFNNNPYLKWYIKFLSMNRDKNNYAFRSIEPRGIYGMRVMQAIKNSIAETKHIDSWDYFPLSGIDHRTDSSLLNIDANKFWEYSNYNNYPTAQNLVEDLHLLITGKNEDHETLRTSEYHLAAHMMERRNHEQTVKRPITPLLKIWIPQRILDPLPIKSNFTLYSNKSIGLQFKSNFGSLRDLSISEFKNVNQHESIFNRNMDYDESYKQLKPYYYQETALNDSSLYSLFVENTFFLDFGRIGLWSDIKESFKITWEICNDRSISNCLSEIDFFSVYSIFAYIF